MLVIGRTCTTHRDFPLTQTATLAMLARAEVRSHLLQEEHYTMRRDEEHNILTRSDAT